MGKPTARIDPAAAAAAAERSSRSDQIGLDPVADLAARLDREVRPARGRGAAGPAGRMRRFWTRYLLGGATLGGAAPAKVRRCVLRWWREHELGEHPAAVGKRIALALIERPAAEDKLAGIIVLHELLGDQLRAADLPAFARLLAGGHLATGDLADRFATTVLAALVERGPGHAETARAVAAWRSATTAWQRRAACLAFTGLAPHGDRALPGLTDLVLLVCGTVVWSHERLDQTAVGWVLRELSRGESARVEAFVFRYARLMSRECARCAVARLPAERRALLLAHHRRATTLRL